MNRPIRASGGGAVHYVREQGRGLVIPINIAAGTAPANLTGVTAVARLRLGSLSRPLSVTIPDVTNGQILIVGTDVDLQTYGGPSPTDVVLTLTDRLGAVQDIVIPLAEDNP